MTGAGQLPVSQERGSHFFLSYAHSAPLVNSPDARHADPDSWVRAFYGDLTDVIRRLSHRAELAPGFIDQEIPLGSDWTENLSRALGAAEVFVPLYSPGYFSRSWPGREWACFHRRMVLAGLSHPERRFVPVLWTPLQPTQNPPGLDTALALGAGEPSYAENGLQALLRFKPYRRSYMTVLEEIAERIVETAAYPLHRAAVAPDIGEARSIFQPDAHLAVFTVEVAAPTNQTAGHDVSFPCYGVNGSQWRPFPQLQIPLAECARQAAERLDFTVQVGEISALGDTGIRRPGLMLIDPWFVASEDRSLLLRSALGRLPPWVLPVVVSAALQDEDAGELSRQVTNLIQEHQEISSGPSLSAASGITSLEEFYSLIAVLIAEAERRYIRHGGRRAQPGQPTVQPTRRPKVRPTLRSGPTETRT